MVLDDLEGANLNRSLQGPTSEVDEQKSEYSLASEAAQELRDALKNPAKEKGYSLEVQIVYSPIGEEPVSTERKLQVTAWPIGRGGPLEHPSHIRALVQGFVPGETYQNFRVQMLMAEPEIFEHQGFELGPEYKPGSNVIDLR